MTQQARFGRPATVGAALCVCLFAAATARGAEPERVRFITADYAEIQGTYYPSDLGIKAPTILMLHPLGGSSDMPGWSDLAKRFQKEKFAVLTFDFRGHGNSTNVSPQFWTAERTNQSLKGYRAGSKPKTTISHNDFRNASNVISLENDIVAAKRFLDTKNDASECNSAKIIVVGAGSGATLGAAWINSEWKRRAVKSGFPVVSNPQPEGHDIAAAVWLSMSPSAGVGTGRWTPRLDNFVGSPVRDNTPMLFLYGDQDSKSASLARSLHGTLVRGVKDKKLKELMREVGLKETKLSGVELLKPSLGTDGTIVTYINQVLEDRTGNPWAKKDIDRVAISVFPINYYLR